MAGQETLSRLLAEGITEAPPGASPDPTAQLAAELDVLAFKTGHAVWSEGTRDADDGFAPYCLAALQELRVASAALE